MKITFKNSIIKTTKFNDATKAKSYYENQKSNSKIELLDTFGDYQYAINSIDTLSKEVLFSLIFSTDLELENINLAISGNGKQWLLETEYKIYLLSLKGKIIVNLDKLTPIIGFHFFKKKLLILEEAGFRIISLKGEILIEQTTDFIEKFELQGKKLLINTSEGEKLNFVLR